jgi:hypothetical protein
VNFWPAIQVLAVVVIGAVVLLGPILLVLRVIAKKYSFAKWQPAQDQHVLFTEFHQNGEGFLNGMTTQSSLVPKDPQNYSKSFVPKDGTGETRNEC